MTGRSLSRVESSSAAPIRSRSLAKSIRLAIGIALVAPAVLCASVIIIGLVLAAPARRVVGAPPADLVAEPIAIASASGATLSGWFVAGSPGRGAVVLMHGRWGNRWSMVRRARLLKAAGFSTLLFDFQAHGESTGARVTFGYLEGLDAAAAVAYLRQRLPDERIGAIGISLGAAAALLGPGPLPVEALVLESAYPDIGAATANRIRLVLGRHLGTIVARPLARLFEVLLSPILAVDPAHLRPIDQIGKTNAALLVASGTRDDRTTLIEALALFARAREPKSFWAVEGAGHVDLEIHAPDEYRRHVLPFLSQHLRRAE